MRKVKTPPTRLVAVILCVALLLPGTALAAQPQYQAHAEALAPLGVFIGTGSDFELDRAPTRIEGLVVLIRLLGVESDAIAMAGEAIPFTDVPAWANGYAAYALANGLTQGMSATVFGSQNTLDAKMFCTFLLRSLGYSDKDGDFEYASAVEFAYAAGLVQQAQMDEIAAGTFLRDQMAKLSYDALFFACKGGELSLLSSLVAAGKIDAAKASVFAATQNAPVTPPAALPDKSLTELAEQAASVVKLDCKYGTGSGVILGENGLIVTNYHVIKGEPWINVIFDDGEKYEGAVYVMDYSEALDLAIIKIEKTGLEAVTIGDSSALKRGERVVAIGSPLGYTNTLSEGIVSGFSDVFGINSIQTSAAISPGSSGGALFDMKGRLVGITFASELNGQNLGFAIPAAYIAQLTQSKMLTLEQFLSELAVPFKSFTATPKAYAEAGDVPDFGYMYGVGPLEKTSDDEYCIYAYDGITEKHVNEYEDWLEKWDYEYSPYFTAMAEREGMFEDPAVFINFETERIVIVDVYYYGDVLTMIVMFEIG